MPTASDAALDVQRLKDEYEELTSRQERVLLDAVYLGVTPRVATECEERRQRLAELFRTLYGHLPEALK